MLKIKSLYLQANAEWVKTFRIVSFYTNYQSHFILFYYDLNTFNATSMINNVYFCIYNVLTI